MTHTICIDMSQTRFADALRASCYDKPYWDGVASMIYDIIDEECRERGEPWFYDYQDIAARFSVYDSLEEYLTSKQLDIIHEILHDYGMFNFLVDNVDEENNVNWEAWLRSIKVTDENSDNLADYLGHNFVNWMNTRFLGHQDTGKFIQAHTATRWYSEASHNLTELCAEAAKLNLPYPTPLTLVDDFIDEDKLSIIDTDSLRAAICSLPGPDDFMEFIKDTPNFWDEFMRDHRKVFAAIVNPDDDYDILIDEDRS